ncbi:hypothetical protein LG314_11655 [Agrococcus terreus]|uniref:hypothetical protein n=1 Tax=Agrococcus terreus TaxID=574649 RepID=UPI00384C1236
MTEGDIPPAPAAAHGPTRAEAAASARRAVIEVAAIQLCGALALLLPRFQPDRWEPLQGAVLAVPLVLWLGIAAAMAYELVERGTRARVLMLILVVVVGAGIALAADVAACPAAPLALLVLVAGLPGIALGTALSRVAARAVAPASDVPGRWRPTPATLRSLGEGWAMLAAASAVAILLAVLEPKALWLVPAAVVLATAWLGVAALGAASPAAPAFRGTRARMVVLVLLVVAATAGAALAGAATGDASWATGGVLLAALLLVMLLPAGMVGVARTGRPRG